MTDYSLYYSKYYNANSSMKQKKTLSGSPFTHHFAVHWSQATSTSHHNIPNILGNIMFKYFQVLSILFNFIESFPDG